ncbi:MAG: HD family hydrolase [Candidatus Thorarchaeota archaeon]|nr:HD family hydrolase [Candidatus Thorarchaeota archaeon]
MTKSEDIIELIRYGSSLKRVNRTGWGLVGVDCIRTESVAEHSYGSALTSVLVSQYLIEKGIQLDIDKTLTMALIHDLPESLTSDIPHISNLYELSELNELKQKIERKAIQMIFNREVSVSKYLLVVWEEFERGSTLESKIVRGSDIIDMLMHVLNLEDTGVSPRILHQFFVSSQEIIKSLEIDILNEIYATLLERHRRNAKMANITLGN